MYYCEWNKWHTKVLLLFLLLPHWKWFRCYGLFFFSENRDQSVEVSAEIMAAWQLDIWCSRSFLVRVKSSTWLSNEKLHVCMKVGSLLYENTCCEWLHVVHVYSKFDRLYIWQTPTPHPPSPSATIVVISSLRVNEKMLFQYFSLVKSQI